MRGSLLLLAKRIRDTVGWLGKLVKRRRAVDLGGGGGGGHVMTIEIETKLNVKLNVDVATGG